MPVCSYEANVLCVAEEILLTNIAHWWSPSGKFIVYAVFNETNVPVHNVPVYGPASNTYESSAEIPYPKASLLVRHCLFNS